MFGVVAFQGDQVLCVFVLASQKGGSGKTILSGYFVVQVQCVGVGPVVLIDIDLQGSLVDWWNECEVEFPVFVQIIVVCLVSDLVLLCQ